MRSDNVQKCSNVYLSLEDQEHTSKSILKDIVENIHDEKIIEDESFIFSEKKTEIRCNTFSWIGWFISDMWWHW